MPVRSSAATDCVASERAGVSQVQEWTLQSDPAVGSEALLRRIGWILLVTRVSAVGLTTPLLRQTEEARKFLRLMAAK